MMGIRSMFATALLASAAIAPAGARTMDSVAGWEMTQTTRNCTMTSTFSDNVSVGLVWAPQTGELGFIASLPHPQPLKNNGKAALALSFDGSTPYTQWDDDAAAVVDGPENVAVIANWGAGHADDLARAVAASGHVTVAVGGRTVGTYELSGSPAAYQALKRCGKLVAGN